MSNLPKVGSLWVRTKPWRHKCLTFRVTEVDLTLEDGEGLVRAVCDPPCDELSGCKYSVKKFLALYTLKSEV